MGISESVLDVLPTLNALLNAICVCWLLAGWIFIRQNKPKAHQACMILALMTSAAFLASYLIYHAYRGSVPYSGQGVWRTVYFTILVTHSVLATAIVPMIFRTLFLAWKKRWEDHRRWARWTWPLWLYVSVTGVVIYRMLYGPWG